MSKWERERRLDYIDDRFASGLTVRRCDIMDHFGVSSPQASHDIRDYMTGAPAVYYDLSAKAYTPHLHFVSVRGSTIERRFAWLAFGKLLNSERTTKT